MGKLLALLLLASPAFSQLTQDPSVIMQTDFSGGLNEYENPLIIQPNESQDLRNVLLDQKNKSVITRLGYSKLNSTALGDGTSDVNAIYQLYTSNGNKYCVAFSSTTGYSSTDGCQTFTAFVSTLTRNNDVNCDAYNDALYCANNQYNFKFDGTNDITVSQMPAQAQYIRVYGNRCFVAGVAGNLSRVYYSNLGSCDIYTTSTDYFDVSPNDGDVITGFGQTIFGGLTIFKKYSTWFLQGSPITGTLTEVSPTTGAKNERSIQTLTGLQVFDSVGPYGSQPGIYGFDGVVVKELSRKLRGDIDLIDTFRQTTNRHSFQTQSDWNAATFSPYALSSNRQSGTMQSSYTAITEQLTSDFANGDMVNLSTYITPGVINVGISSFGFTNGDMSLGNLNNWTVSGGWSALNQSGGQGDSCGVSYGDAKNTCHAPLSNYLAYSPSCGSPINNLNGNFVVEDANGTSLITCGFTYNPNAVNWKITSGPCILSNGLSQSSTTVVSGGSVVISTTNFNYNLYPIARIKIIDSSGNYMESPSTFSANTMQAFLMGSNPGPGCPSNYISIGFNTCGYRVFMTTAIYTSMVYDTAISTPIWGPFSSTFTMQGVGAGSADLLTYGIASSSSTSGVFSTVAIASDTLKITGLPTSRYLIYYATAAMQNDSLGRHCSTNTVSINAVSIPAASTGVWTSNPLFLSNNITNGGWGLFTTVQSIIGSSATITYAIKSGTSTTSVQSASFTPITPGTTIGISTGAYVMVQANYQMDTASDTALTSNITINWNEGAQATTPTSAIYQGRYHYGAQGLNGKTNNVIYILDTNGAWVKWDDLYPRYLAVVNQNLIMGDASTGTSAGNVFQLYTGGSDNGSPIHSYYQTKDFNVGEISHMKSVDKIYLIFNNNPTTLSLDILADGGQLDINYSVAMSTGFPYTVKMIPVEPAINANSFSLKFSNNAISQPWGIVGSGMHYTDLGLMGP